jgi:hypothetical protein
MEERETMECVAIEEKLRGGAAIGLLKASTFKVPTLSEESGTREVLMLL